VTLEVTGTVQDFDGDAFRINLASMIDGVAPSDIELNVTAASVLVIAKITASNTTAANQIVTALSDATRNSTETLSQALGVTVIRAQAPIIEVVIVDSSNASSPVITSLVSQAVAENQAVSNNTGSGSLVIILTSTGVAFVILLALLRWYYVSKPYRVPFRLQLRRNKSIEKKDAVQADSGTMHKKYDVEVDVMSPAISRCTSPEPACATSAVSSAAVVDSAKAEDSTSKQQAAPQARALSTHAALTLFEREELLEVAVLQEPEGLPALDEAGEADLESMHAQEQVDAQEEGVLISQLSLNRLRALQAKAQAPV